jgi:cation transporter-like permease
VNRWTLIALVGVGLLAVVVFGVWAVIATQSMGSWTGGSLAILWSIIAAAVFTGGLTGALMWLAFYSSRKGYDEPFRAGDNAEEPPDAPPTSPEEQSGPSGS